MSAQKHRHTPTAPDALPVPSQHRVPEPADADELAAVLERAQRAGIDPQRVLIALDVSP